jgi:hypothetical protein
VCVCSFAGFSFLFLENLGFVTRVSRTFGVRLMLSCAYKCILR